MEYEGFFERVNDKPEGEYIFVFVSDWLKDLFAFYAYISLDSYEEDIAEINELKNELNPGRDIYVELIGRSEGLKDFYSYTYDNSEYSSHSSILDPDWWDRHLN